MISSVYQEEKISDELNTFIRGMGCLSVRETITSFYQYWKCYLLENYPGITCQRLLSELEYLFPKEEVPLSEILDSTYISSVHDPLRNFFKSLLKGIPLQYIHGRTYFYRSEFILGPQVLVPRYETEMLVELAQTWILKLSKNNEKNNEKNNGLFIADVGTGSGIIIISLLQQFENEISGYAIDISKSALEIAKRNYFNLRFSIPQKSSLKFIQGDRLYKVDNQMHLIVSNPPYIMRNSGSQDIHKNVLKYEPEVALFLDDDKYFEWFELFFKQALYLLYDGGVFIMEGHVEHLLKLSKLACEVGFASCKIIKDLAGQDRFIIARKKNG